MKRIDNITWDEYFMGIACLSAQRSKDPSTQVGACIVSPDNKIVSVGYNGFPLGCSDDDLPWGKDDPDENNTKYPYVVHAETNALLNTNSSLQNCTIYVTLFPCSDCTRNCIQAGIKKIVYLEQIKKPRYLHSAEAAKKMMKLANIECVEYKLGKHSELQIKFTK